MIVNHSNAIVQGEKGVIATDPMFIPPIVHNRIMDELNKQGQTNGLILKVSFKEGANLVFVHRTNNGWEIDATVGSQWNGNIVGYIQVMKRW